MVPPARLTLSSSFLFHESPSHGYRTGCIHQTSVQSIYFSMIIMLQSKGQLERSLEYLVVRPLCRGTLLVAATWRHAYSTAKHTDERSDSPPSTALLRDGRC
ncbi:hypothetical protein DAEQUDRAFT_332807 [Daedalea quercina L-15889]|uniref:Uncharacterized protein n=1 Tax=Daedalea quercina L-15889 TaxID=1314783 RepID=A0A165PM58_9APHY|nr:hypothetical protein DAEQUDRAFT_332807 [Daedalea quercina L-15889]